jgi:hypothetical protein
MNTSSNTPTIRPTMRHRIIAVCNRLQILTPNQCQETTYAEHMVMAIDSFCDFEVKPSKADYYEETLKKYGRNGIRHCDMFDILYRMLFENKHLDSAINDIRDEFVENGDFELNEFYGFMNAVGREEEYNKLWSTWHKSKKIVEVDENGQHLIQSSWEIGGGKVGHVSIMNELRNDSGVLIDSWVEEMPTTPNIENWESYLQKNGQTFLIASDDLYSFVEETGFTLGNGTPNGRGCSRHDLLLNGNPTLYSVDVYTPFEWYTDHKGNKFEDFEQSIGE